MAFTELISTAVARGERYEYDYVINDGDTIAVTNNNWDYGTTQYWGVLMWLGYDLLGGTPNIFYSLPLYAKSHTKLVSSQGIAVDLQPAIYCPKSYRLPYLEFKLWKWIP